jgi:hypothetical protein
LRGFGLVSSLFEGDKRWALAAFFVIGFLGLLRVSEPAVDQPEN